MNRERKLYYYKYVVKRHLRELKSNIEAAKNDMERRFYIDRYAVQLSIYAKTLNVYEKHLAKYISNENLEGN